MTVKTAKSAPTQDQNITLKRTLTLPLVTLYGLGVTIGAGIYVLVGATAAVAGFYAPVSFLLAAFVTAFTGLSYAELSTRMPVSAGEAAYVRAGFKSSTLALIVGLLVATSGVVSSAAISIGAAGYLQYFLPVSPALLTFIIIAVMGLIAFWGIMESVFLAGIFTILEIFGLALVIYTGFASNPDLISDLPKLVPPMELASWTGVFAASLLAFFAFIGFEDIANVAEEVKNPHRTMPWAIFLTLSIATLVYVAVVSVVVLSVPMETLATSNAPLGLIFDQSSSHIVNLFKVIAVVATLNGVLIQMIMASRILYGLASKGELPKILATIHPQTRTPVVATLLIVGVILVLALFLPITRLGETTSQIVLVVFSLVNLSLIRLKMRGDPVPEEVFQIPAFIPVIGLVTCVGLLLSGLL